MLLATQREGHDHMATELVNNNFAEVAFGRTAMRSLDRNVKIPREEILEIIKEATCAPSAVDTQPWHFLVVDTDEGKEKLDSYMWEVDRGRVTNASAAVVMLADVGWLEDFEYIAENYMANDDEDARAYLTKLTVDWALGMSAHELELSVTCQSGLVAMMLMLVLRAHGYDSGPMDALDRAGLVKDFGLDEDRYKISLVIAIGKATAEPIIKWRKPPETVTTFA